MARIGLLTGGGDCPGLNAVIRGVVRRGLAGGHTMLGFRHGGRPDAWRRHANARGGVVHSAIYAFNVDKLSERFGKKVRVEVLSEQPVRLR